MPATLLTLAQAKQHLKITLPALDPGDPDIQLKLDQAESMILDYLNNPSTNVLSVSVANPTVITTEMLHGLTSGVTYTLAGTTTTPTVNGARVVTVTGPTTFTVPVNVTVGQSDEAGSVSTAVYTTATAPGAVTAAICLLLTDLFQHLGDDQRANADLWESIDRVLKRNRQPALA